MDKLEVEHVENVMENLHIALAYAHRSHSVVDETCGRSMVLKERWRFY